MKRTMNIARASGFRIKALAVACGLVLGAISCSQEQPAIALDAAAVEAELRAMETAHEAAIDAKNVEAVLDFYAPDLITVPLGGEILQGREWVRSTVAELFQTYDSQETFTLSDIRVFGDRAAATLQYTQQMTPLAGGETVIETGKGLCILKRSEPGKWQFEWNAYGPDVEVTGVTE